MVLPKPIYEALPLIYLGTAVATLNMNDNVIRFFPVLLLILVCVMVVYMRISSRKHDASVHGHQSTRQRKHIRTGQHRFH